MAVKIYKPVTPGLRNRTGYTFEEITKSKPERSLIVFRKSTGGRNNPAVRLRFFWGPSPLPPRLPRRGDAPSLDRKSVV